MLKRPSWSMGDLPRRGAGGELLEKYRMVGELERFRYLGVPSEKFDPLFYSPGGGVALCEMSFGGGTMFRRKPRGLVSAVLDPCPVVLDNGAAIDEPLIRGVRFGQALHRSADWVPAAVVQIRGDVWSLVCWERFGR